MVFSFWLLVTWLVIDFKKCASGKYFALARSSKECRAALLCKPPPQMSESSKKGQGWQTTDSPALSATSGRRPMGIGIRLYLMKGEKTSMAMRPKRLVRMTLAMMYSIVLLLWLVIVG